MKKLEYVLLGSRVVGVLSIICVWQFLSSISFGPIPIPSITSVGSSLAHRLTTIPFLSDCFVTIAHTLIGSAVAIIFGTLLGILIGLSPVVFAAFEVPIDFLRSIPVSAWFPLVIIFLGVGTGAKLFLVIIAVGCVVVFQVSQGVLHAPPIRRKIARTLGASRWRIFMEVALGEALPHVLVSSRVGVSLAFVVVMVTEMFLGATEGLGKRLIDSQQMFDINAMLGSLIVSGIIGYSLNFVLQQFARRYVHWVSTSD